MTEKLFKRSVIYKLLAARKKCYRFFAKKREKHDPLSKKKIRLFSAWNFTARVCLQMTQQFCAFSSLPTSSPPKMSVLLPWSQSIIMIKIHETFNQNQLFLRPTKEDVKIRLEITKNWDCAKNSVMKTVGIIISVTWKLEESVRVGNIRATIVLRCSSEPESEALSENVKISELGQKLPEIATFFQK